MFSGGSEVKGYENLVIGKRIIRLTGGPSWWVKDPDSMTLLQIFRCLQILTFTSGWSHPQDKVTEDEGYTGDRASFCEAARCPNDIAFGPNPMSRLESLPLMYTLDISYGISMVTLRCLDRIVGLSKAKQNIQARRGSWPPESIGELVKLESELFDVLDNPDVLCERPVSGSVNPNGTSDYISEEVRNNHIWAFHYSTALFFRRALCDGSADITPAIGPRRNSPGREPTRPTGQMLVSMALEHLENIDAISSGSANASTLWPGFIAAVEATEMDLRQRALIWFARALRHGIGNTAKAKALVLEVWRRVDRQTWASPVREKLSSELGSVDWREVMREKSMYIVLT